MAAGQLEPKIEPLFSAEAIAARIEEIARTLQQAELHDPLIVAILKGSFVFAADLVRGLHRAGLRPEIDFLYLASYGAGNASQGEVKVLHDVGSEVKGRDVVIVDDILDSGRTLALAKERLLARRARKVLTCVLIDKQCERAVAISPDLSGFTCPPVFVVGYGMDLAHRYRELPFIGRVSPDQ
jgi:hypoxanthine phosphoribosyltransferase